MAAYVEGFSPSEFASVHQKHICTDTALSFPCSLTDHEVRMLHFTIPLPTQRATDQIKGNELTRQVEGETSAPYSHVIDEKVFIYRKDMSREMAMLPRPCSRMRSI